MNVAEWITIETDAPRATPEADLLATRSPPCVPLQRDTGYGQPPTVTPLVSEGYLCPPGKEYDSLEWELARWLVDNKV